MEKFQISLAAARINANLTQEEVAKMMQLNKQTIVNWEKGRTKIGLPQLEMLSRIYNAPIDSIFLPIKSS